MKKDNLKTLIVIKEEKDSSSGLEEKEYEGFN